MRQKPEALFSLDSLASVFLFYGNNTTVIEYLSTVFFPKKLGASSSEVDVLEEAQVLSVSKTQLYTDASLFNPKKLMLIRGVTDKLLPLVESYQQDMPLILVGKNLRANSKLVKFMQEHRSYSAVAIYEETVSLLTNYFRHELRDYRFDRDSISALLAVASTFGEAQRLIQLLQQLCSAGDLITEEHIQKLSSQYRSPEIFSIVSAILGKNPRAMVNMFEKNKEYLAKELIPILRVTAKQLWELVDLTLKVSQGGQPLQVVKSTMPKIPFQRHSEVVANLQKWNMVSLLTALLMLDQIEILYKQTKEFSWSIAERMFLKLCKL